MIFFAGTAFVVAGRVARVIFLLVAVTGFFFAAAGFPAFFAALFFPGAVFAMNLHHDGFSPH
jgi:hypothetical protein